MKLSVNMLSIRIQLWIDKMKMKRSARNNEREQFIRTHGKDLGEDYAGEFYDKYH